MEMNGPDPLAPCLGGKAHPAQPGSLVEAPTPPQNGVLPLLAALAAKTNAMLLKDLSQLQWMSGKLHESLATMEDYARTMKEWREAADKCDHMLSNGIVEAMSDGSCPGCGRPTR